MLKRITIFKTVFKYFEYYASELSLLKADTL